MKITVIPLDSRPCNTVWLNDLAKMAGYELTMYPRALCGDLLVGANFDQMLAWLDDEITDTDYLIVAADGLCSGGLVQARLGQIDAFAVMDRLEVFSEYKKRFPHLKIYVFDTIMRTSITALNKETEKYWGKMNEYSRLLGRTYFFNDEKEIYYCGKLFTSTVGAIEEPVLVKFVFKAILSEKKPLVCKKKELKSTPAL